jgi:hypothetical protein
MLRVLGLSCLLVAFVAGCGLFSTRTAEPPDTGPSSWKIPVKPDSVLVNMAHALSERNDVNYLLSFDRDRFEFDADNVALANNPSLRGWNYEADSSHIRRLFSEPTLPHDSISVTFQPATPQYGGDSATISTKYTLHVGVALAVSLGNMMGTADFTLHMREGYWQIYLWRDRRTEDANTWSDLKARVQ